MTRLDRCQVRVDSQRSNGPCWELATTWNIFADKTLLHPNPFPLCDYHESYWSAEPGRVIMTRSELEIWLVMQS